MASTSSSSPEGSARDGSERPTESVPALGGDSILGTTAGDRCNVCGSEMASDQAYCLECGTRRGRPRFTLDGARQAAAANGPVVRSGPGAALTGIPPRRGWWASSASATLVAGVAVLLLAIGVGFEIGHSGRPAPSTGSPKIVVNGGGGGSSSAAGTTGSTGTTGSGSSSGSSGIPHVKPATTKKALAADLAKAAKAPTKAVQAKQAQAANQVLHTKGGVKIAPPTATVGSSCSAGTAGCQGGKITGNYFGTT